MNYSDAVRAIAADFKRRKSEYEQAELRLLSSNAEFAESEREKRALLLAAAKGEKPDSEKLEKAKKQTAKNSKKFSQKTKPSEKGSGLFRPVRVAPCVPTQGGQTENSAIAP